jgi:hypothetical protein
MADCEECDKKLGIIEGYRHPALGTRFLVCGKCFNKIYEDMEQWNTFCVSDSFNAESSMIDIQTAWNKNISNDPPLQKWFNKLWIKIGSQPC